MTTKDEQINSEVGACAEEEELFSKIQDDVEKAIKIFINRYQSYHQVVILAHELEKKTMVEAGSNFISGIVRLNFTFQRIDQRQFHSSVILKIPQLGAFKTYGQSMRLYDKERYVYEHVIPLMYASWSHKKAPPNFYGSTESGILVLENLLESGFYAKQKGTLLDLSGCKVVLRSFAQFHALSLAHIDRVALDLDSLTVADRGNSEWAAKLYPPLVQKLRKHVLPLFSDDVRKKFDDYVANVSSTIKLGFSPNEGGFNVILHGDAQCYNMLFKNDDQNNVIQCKFIDFQGTRRGSPIIDLMQFLVMSIDIEDFETNHDALFSYYLSEFHAILKELQVQNPSQYGLHELFADFEKYKFFFLYYLTCAVPIFWAGQLDMGAKSEENNVDVVIKSARYITFFRGWVKYLL